MPVRSSMKVKVDSEDEKRTLSQLQRKLRFEKDSLELSMYSGTRRPASSIKILKPLRARNGFFVYSLPRMNASATSINPYLFNELKTTSLSSL